MATSAKKWLSSDEFFRQFERKKLLASMLIYKNNRAIFESQLPSKIKASAPQIKIFIFEDEIYYPAKAIAAHAFAHLIKPGDTFQSGKRLRRYLEREGLTVYDNEETPTAFLAAKTSLNLDNERNELEQEQYFDFRNDEDARHKTNRAITIREGQAQFRSLLLKEFNYRCIVTDCDASEALEAAHIVSYNGKNTNIVTNGLLLRADIHTLFDKRLIYIDHENMTLKLADQLKKTSYNSLDGKKIHLNTPWKHSLEVRNNYDSK